MMVKAKIFNIFLFTFYCVNLDYCNSQGLLGKADIEVIRVETCPGSENDQYKANIWKRKIDRDTESWNGDAEIDMDIGEGIAFQGIASSRVDGGYKEVYRLNDSNACEFFLNYFEKKFKEMLTKIGVEEKCPIPAGVYSIEDFILEKDSVDIDLIYGDYRVDAFLYHEEKRIFCLRVHGTASPKNGGSLW